LQEPILKRSAGVFDIGCNVGAASIIASVNDPDRQIVLVDPNLRALSLAKENLESNSMGTNKQYVSAFVSDVQDASVKFYTVGSGAAGSMYGSHIQTAKKNSDLTTRFRQRQLMLFMLNQDLQPILSKLTWRVRKSWC
jgi:FkbM family methyltransferase